jgi:hypothetical protein
MTKSNVFALRRVNAFALRQMAATAHPYNRVHQARYIQAIRYLRRRNLWIRDGAKVSWGQPGESVAA